MYKRQGLEFARIAAQRGHNVTLYEASGKLGGQLKHADYPSFKWPLKQFKNFMIAQMDRLGAVSYTHLVSWASLVPVSLR